MVTAETEKLFPFIIKVALEVPAPTAVIRISKLYSVEAATAIPDEAQVATAPVPKQYRQFALVVESASHQTPVVGWAFEVVSACNPTRNLLFVIVAPWPTVACTR